MLLLLAISCNKDKTSHRNLSSFAFPGTWKWVLTTGGFAGIHETPASTGNSMTLILNADSTLSLVENGHTTTGTYRTGKDSLSVRGTVYDTIGISTGLGAFIYSHNMDSLFLVAYCCDRFNYVFVKQ